MGEVMIVMKMMMMMMMMMIMMCTDSLFTLCTWTYEAAWYGDGTLDGAEFCRHISLVL